VSALPGLADAHFSMPAAIAGALALAFGGAPLGVLLIARRMSLVGDALSHGILPGAALAYLVTGPDPVALTLGALGAGFIVAILSSLLARTGRLPEDASFAVFYLSALALGVVILGRSANSEALLDLLFGGAGGLDATGLIVSAIAASATLIFLALFLRGFLAESADPVFMRASGLPGGLLHLLLMTLVALNLVAGFRAFGALMTVGLMMIPAASARFWARGYTGQAAAAVLISVLASGSGLWLAQALGWEPGAIMTLCASVLFAASALIGPNKGLLQNLPGRTHLEG
jgi:zinc/manganese transport system permease protein